MKLPGLQVILNTQPLLPIPMKQVKLKPLQVNVNIEPTNTEIVYPCLTCERPFKRKSDMFRHSRIHLKVKPFSCFICEKGFTRRDTLTRHQKQHELKKKIIN